MKDEELKLQDIEVSLTLGAAGEVDLPFGPKVLTFADSADNSVETP